MHVPGDFDPDSRRCFAKGRLAQEPAFLLVLPVLGRLVGERFLARETNSTRGVDVDALGEHLVSLFENIRDLVDTTRGEMTDVNQSVRTREDLGESTEVCDPLHLGQVDPANFRFLRQLVHHRHRLLDRCAVRPEDRDPARILDVDLGAGRFLDGARQGQ